MLDKIIKGITFDTERGVLNICALAKQDVEFIDSVLVKYTQRLAGLQGSYLARKKGKNKKEVQEIEEKIEILEKLIEAKIEMQERLQKAQELRQKAKLLREAIAEKEAKKLSKKASQEELEKILAQIQELEG